MPVTQTLGPDLKQLTCWTWSEQGQIAVPMSIVHVYVYVNATPVGYNAALVDQNADRVG